VIESTKIAETEIPELLKALENFCILLLDKPFDNWGGLRGVSAFALYWYIQKIKPDMVIEVGVWKGFSTWIIENAAPDANIICLDPMFFLEEAIKNGSISPAAINSDIVGNVYRTKKAQYFSNDFSCLDMQDMLKNCSNPCAFFDDHQHKLPRLKQAKDYGIKNIIFDDNQPFPYTHKSLEIYMQDLTIKKYLSDIIEDYQVFPALWDTTINYAKTPVELKGLNIPQIEQYKSVYDDRQWHSFVTMVTLK
jgi:hypothetical protein